MKRKVAIGKIKYDSDSIPLIAGPCVIESRDHSLKMAEAIRSITDSLEIPFIYKSSFDKANRTAANSFRGPSIDEGLSILSDIKKEINVPVLTDVHLPDQCGFVAEVVAFAFGLAAASFFPAIILGVFSKRMNRNGAVLGMVVGITFTAAYIIYFKFINPSSNTADHWWFGISPEGIGTLGMLLNLAVATVVSRFTPAPPERVVALVDRMRMPNEPGS